MTRILCFGGRDYQNLDAIRAALDLIPGTFAIIQGGARGADALCAAYGRARGLPVIEISANWDKFQKAAGSIRNQWMLEYCLPTRAIGFPGGAGSRDMARRLAAAGTPLWLPYGGVSI